MRGIAHDDGKIASVQVNGQLAKTVVSPGEVVDWQIELPRPKDGKLLATSIDDAGNKEQTGHLIQITN